MFSLGGGTARALSAIRERIPGAAASAGQGVSVGVGDTQAAVDLQVLVHYGHAIADLANAVRGSVITAIEPMTGLQAVEVNISVTDVHLSDEKARPPTTGSPEPRWPTDRTETSASRMRRPG